MHKNSVLVFSKQFADESDEFDIQQVDLFRVNPPVVNVYQPHYKCI